MPVFELCSHVLNFPAHLREPLHDLLLDLLKCAREGPPRNAWTKLGARNDLSSTYWFFKGCIAHTRCVSQDHFKEELKFERDRLGWGRGVYETWNIRFLNEVLKL